MTNIEKKITKKDNYELLRAIVEEKCSGDENTANLLLFIDKELEALKKHNAKNIRKDASKDALSESVLAVLNSAPDYAFSIAEVLSLVDTELAPTQQKVVYRLTKLVENGQATKTSQAVKEEGQPTRKVTVYKVI